MMGESLIRIYDLSNGQYNEIKNTGKIDDQKAVSLWGSIEALESPSDYALCLIHKELVNTKFVDRTDIEKLLSD
ncbi:hypothetical protein L0B53_14465 [Vibrio sp. SS-MA-C1-2]|uniref:hypothetical protein n=1 Tax=Vibrio sp. SS-MA-C1-2 TaxID=2908646 RepID=UPI001F3F0D42|nr:hypothetical protein [Vibrio sp. SS-MA-C1-2]UJF18212.1 hypothetical protein L0B53_14465 [Vibrio sp. SS-MA-C1-2]